MAQTFPLDTILRSPPEMLWGGGVGLLVGDHQEKHSNKDVVSMQYQALVFSLDESF